MELPRVLRRPLAALLISPLCASRVLAGGGPIPAKLSQESASLKEQFTLTVEIPAGCSMAAIKSDDFTIETWQDFKPDAPHQRPHLQPTGHVHEVTTGGSGFNGFNQPLGGPSFPSEGTATTRTYVLRAKQAGTLTLGPFKVLCPRGARETPALSIQIKDDGSDSLGKVVGIQDFTPARSAGAVAPPSPETAHSPVPAAPTAVSRPASAPDPDDSRPDYFSERNLLVVAVGVLSMIVIVLVLKQVTSKA